MHSQTGEANALGADLVQDAVTADSVDVGWRRELENVLMKFGARDGLGLRRRRDIDDMLRFRELRHGERGRRSRRANNELTPSLEINSLAAATEASGRSISSRSRISSFLPLIPPTALI